MAGEAAMAAAALDRALALNPNAAHAWRRGLIHTSRNQPEAAIEAIERPRRLSPFAPYTFLYALYIALAHLAARRFEQAIEWADRALHEQPRMVAAMRSKVAANAPSRPARRGARRTYDRIPDAMGMQRQTVEHPFGTLKAWMGATHFLTRTLDKLRKVFGKDKVTMFEMNKHLAGHLK